MTTILVIIIAVLLGAGVFYFLIRNEEKDKEAVYVCDDCGEMTCTCHLEDE